MSNHSMLPAGVRVWGQGCSSGRPENVGGGKKNGLILYLKGLVLRTFIGIHENSALSSKMGVLIDCRH